ncbi:MAG: hypothetical protein M1839_004634 [Geoglossum umbratile]|nr:MAG: hypothetical protein M1839_004634 [Geoglossum umbratile]
MTVNGLLEHGAERYRPPYHSVEVARLRSQHEWLKSGIGQLVLAPLEKTAQNMRILDSGTADGYWLVDLSRSLPATTTYVGTDVDYHRFNRDCGKEFTFVTQGATGPWPSSWSNAFDLVHQRLFLSRYSPEVARQTVHNLADLVKPGGYIQLTEPDFTVFGKVISVETPAQRRFSEMSSKVFAAMGGVSTPGPNLRQWVENCGLEEIEERVFDLDIGKRCKDPIMAKISIRNLLELVKRFKSAAECGMIEHTPEECDELGRDLKEELETIGGTARAHVVWGRKRDFRR